MVVLGATNRHADARRPLRRLLDPAHPADLRDQRWPHVLTAGCPEPPAAPRAHAQHAGGGPDVGTIAGRVDQQQLDAPYMIQAMGVAAAAAYGCPSELYKSAQDMCVIDGGGRSNGISPASTGSGGRSGNTAGGQRGAAPSVAAGTRCGSSGSFPVYPDDGYTEPLPNPVNGDGDDDGDDDDMRDPEDAADLPDRPERVPRGSFIPTPGRGEGLMELYSLARTVRTASQAAAEAVVRVAAGAAPAETRVLAPEAGLQPHRNPELPVSTAFRCGSENVVRLPAVVNGAYNVAEIFSQVGLAASRTKTSYFGVVGVTIYFTFSRVACFFFLFDLYSVIL